MIGVKPIVMKRDVARKKWKEYLKASKIHGDKYLKELKGLYYHLSNERKVIDVFEAIKFAGLNAKNEPRLAICKADNKTVTFRKESNRKGTFESSNYRYNVNLPNNTFNIDFPSSPGRTWDIINQRIKTKVPIVPANKLPEKGSLKDHFILWEVEDWEVIPKDPFLLKRISNNLFVVISSWNLTKLERALMNG